MAKTGPQNSVIDESSPLTVPEPEEAPAKEPDDFRRLGQSSHWPKVAEKIDQRIVMYQQYLPSGQPLSTMSKEERAEKWLLADTVIRELTELKAFIEQSAR